MGDAPKTRRRVETIFLLCDFHWEYTNHMFKIGHTHEYVGVNIVNHNVYNILQLLMLQRLAGVDFP